jgi:hypothetical protein
VAPLQLLLLLLAMDVVKMRLLERVRRVPPILREAVRLQRRKQASCPIAGPMDIARNKLASRITQVIHACVTVSVTSRLPLLQTKWAVKRASATVGAVLAISRPMNRMEGWPTQRLL